MNHYQFSSSIQKIIRTLLLLTVVLLSITPFGVLPAYAAPPPPNDTWQTPTAIGSIPFSETLDTTAAHNEIDEPDITTLGTCQGEVLNAGLATVWYTYAAPANALISLDTLGSTSSEINPVTHQVYQYDTYIAVWTGNIASNPTLVACNDDSDAGYQSQLGFNVVAGTTYYIQVAEYNGQNGTFVNPGYNGGSLKFHVGYGSHVDVFIGGTKQGNTFTLLPGQSVRPTYNLDSGPVKIVNNEGNDTIAALRDAWLINNQVTSFAQMMGLPQGQLSDTYYFPAYNNVTLSGQLRIANVDSVATDVTVTIAGVPQLPAQHLLPNQSWRPTYNLDAGPVVVKSSGGTKIIAALRDAWMINNQVTSFVQLMGLPKESLSDTYYFPAYNNVTLSGQLRIGNVDTVATDVTVTIAGVPQLPAHHLNPNESWRPTYNLDAGPVVVKSSGGTKIIAALRDAWMINGQVHSFAQLMGLPKEKLSDTYLFPAYNNVTLSGQLRIGNVDTVATDVTVTIAGVDRGTYHLTPNQSVRPTYALDAGPVVVKSSGGTKIIAALRDAWMVNGQVTSFVQLMGLPKEALSAIYWFPAYNNVTLSGQLRIGVP